MKTDTMFWMCIAESIASTPTALLNTLLNNLEAII